MTFASLRCSDGPTRPSIIGHRGAPGYRPEHTASSYLLALQSDVDAVEPDVVVTKDGVLVIRHENEISATTDVADHAHFSSRHTTKIVDGKKLTGWFTEDFTWAELSTLRCRERIPALRPANTIFNDSESMLRLTDLLILIDQFSAAQTVDSTLAAVVIEIKHAHYFMGLGFDIAELVMRDLAATGWDVNTDRIVYESFELGVLDRLKTAGAPGKRVFLTETDGFPADAATLPGEMRPWDWYRSNVGLASLVGRVHGISIAKSDLFQHSGRGSSPRTNDFVARAHAAGLLVFVWTLRPENHFLLPGHRSSGEKLEPGDWRAEWSQVVATGVDGVFVDHPDLMRFI